MCWSEAAGPPRQQHFIDIYSNMVFINQTLFCFSSGI
jgi:hypothetical protein